ncbi:hypothetical protein [Phaeobacter inhibens]|uniref:hypothetical protein n=1 Tax=Phaeobacter inhibens TaxID=221822 RepID=UPI0020C7CB76|nr:hypothetical protein [Phaeobacter inhibens]
MIDMGDDGEIADVSQVCHARGYDLVLGFGQAGMSDNRTRRSKRRFEVAVNMRFNVVVAREILRQLAFLQHPFDSEKLGWTIFTQFYVLRVVAISVRVSYAPTRDMIRMLGSALDKVSYAPKISGDPALRGDPAFSDIIDLTKLLAPTKSLRKTAVKGALNDILLRGHIDGNFLDTEGKRKSLRNDIGNFDNISFSDPLFDTPLDPEISKFISALDLNSATINHWRDWYQSFLDGKPLDWELQRRVALIDDAIWEAGPEAVAAEIERIKAEVLTEKLPVAEAIELNPETGKFRAVPIKVENAPYMSALLSQISDALEDCLGGHNGLSDASGDVKKLNRVLTKYRDDPQNAELTLTRVAGSLRGQLHDSRELPDNEYNLALLNAVEEGVRGIRANHPEVAENREQLARQAFKTLSPEEKQVLEEALPILTAISEAELAEDFAQDIPELINDAALPLANGAPPLPGADAATRVFSRISKMALLKDQYDTFTRKGAEWFDSDTRKTVQLAGLVGGGVIAVGVKFGPKLLELVQIGLRLLGVL